MRAKDLVFAFGLCPAVLLMQGLGQAQVIIDSSLTKRYVAETNSYACRPGIAVEAATGNLAIAFIRFVPELERTLSCAISVDQGNSWRLFEGLDLGVTRDNKRDPRSFHVVTTPQTPVIAWEEGEASDLVKDVEYVPVITRNLSGWNADDWKSTIIDSFGTQNHVLQARYLMLSIAPDNPSLWGIAAYHRRQPDNKPGEYVMFYRSVDAGQSWSQREIVAYSSLAFGGDSTKDVGDIIESSGVHVTLGPNQTGLYAFIGELADGDPLANPLYCLTTDGGLSWTPPAHVPGTESLRCSFSSFAPGYVATFLDANGNWHILTIGIDVLTPYQASIYDLKLSEGNWSKSTIPMPASGPAGVLFGYRSRSPLHPAVAPDGTIYLAYSCLADTTGINLTIPMPTQNIDIYISKSQDDGNTWSEPTNVTETPNMAENYVSLAPVVTDRLHLTYTVEPSGDVEPWYLYYHAVSLESIGTKVAGDAGSSPYPQSLELLQNAPNPFVSATAIAFELKREEQVRLSVLNIMGQEIKVLLQGRMPPGRHQLNWNATGMPAGVYFVKLSSSEERLTRKMIFLPRH